MLVSGRVITTAFWNISRMTLPTVTSWPCGTTTPEAWSVLYCRIITFFFKIFGVLTVPWGEKIKPMELCYLWCVSVIFSCDLAKNWLLVPVEVTSGAKKHFVGSKRSANRMLQRWKQIIHFNPIVGGSGLSGIWENPNVIPRAAAW